MNTSTDTESNLIQAEASNDIRDFIEAREAAWQAHESEVLHKWVAEREARKGKS